MRCSDWCGARWRRVEAEGRATCPDMAERTWVIPRDDSTSGSSAAARPPTYRRGRISVGPCGWSGEGPGEDASANRAEREQWDMCGLQTMGEREGINNI